MQRKCSEPKVLCLNCRPEALIGLRSCTVSQIGQVVCSLRDRKRSVDVVLPLAQPHNFKCTNGSVRIVQIEGD